MKFKFYIFLFVFGIILNSTSLSIAQDTTKIKKVETAKKQGFVDKDGDGYNDNAPDHDGDGIPNGLDPDWQKLKKGKGEGKGKKRRFIDLDGDGIDDNIKSEEIQGSDNKKKIDDSKGSSIDSDKTGKQQQRQKRQGNRR